MIEAIETAVCDNDCGARKRLPSNCNRMEFLRGHGWDMVTISGQRMLCCGGCIEKGNFLKAIINTRRGGKYGPEADCG